MKEKLVVGLLVLLLAASIVVGGVLIFVPAPQPSGAPAGFASSWRIIGKEAVGIVHLYGEIHGGADSSLSDTGGADSLVRRLKTLGEDERIRAIILRINSPGGSVGGSQEVYDEVQRLRKQGIKMVASIADMGASGAYYIASGCDHVVANPGALVGSVGVIMMVPDISGLTQGMLKINVNTIKSGEFKDMGSMFRNMTERERAKFQGIVDDAFEQFKQVVLEGRARVRPEMTYDDTWIEEYLNGVVVTGQQALDAGLIEELGGLEEAKAAARKLAGLPEDVAYISEQHTLLDLVARQFGMRQSNLDQLAGRVDALQQVRFEYMFRPGL